MHFKKSLKIILLSYVLITANYAQSNNEHDLGDLVARITYLEEKIRFLNGKVEELEHLKQETNEKFEQFEKNTKELIAGIQASITKQSTNNSKDLAKNIEANKSSSNLAESRNNDAVLQKYTKIKKLLDTKNFDLAEKEMQSFINEFSNNKLTAYIHYMLGELKYNKGLYEAASLQYLYSQKKFPKSDYAVKSLHKLSLCLEKIKKYNEMCTVLNKILTEYPTADKKIIELAQNKKIKQQCK